MNVQMLQKNQKKCWIMAKENWIVEQCKGIEDILKTNNSKQAYQQAKDLTCTKKHLPRKNYNWCIGRFVCCRRHRRTYRWRTGIRQISGTAKPNLGCLRYREKCQETQVDDQQHRWHNHWQWRETRHRQ